MKKIKLPRRLKKALSYSYILHSTKHQYTKAVRKLLNDTTTANKTLRWLRMEDLSRRFNESPYRLYETLGSVTLEDLAGWEYMNKLLPVERRKWQLREKYIKILLAGHIMEEMHGISGGELKEYED